MCSGCILEPSQMLIGDFLKKCHLAIEWNSQLIEEDYSPVSSEIMRHSSIYEHQADTQEQEISLEKCLEKFHDVERLDEPSYCARCRNHHNHQK